MDITLVLTHRCNLACTYCFAGEKRRREMGPEVMDGALDLLFADGGATAQLSFFGGEPFLAFPAMQRAVAGGRQRASAARGELLLQCTTNATRLTPEVIDFVKQSGMQLTVSLDGVREAHEENRPAEGGRSSFDDAFAGLQALLAAGCDPDVLMVITPATVPFVFRSVTWLFGLGVKRVQANLELGARWSWVDRDLLRQELTMLARQILHDRLLGKAVDFEPFGVPRHDPLAADDDVSQRRPRAVVATSGNIYPCAPMVGEDRDSGPEASLRVGHLRDGAEALSAAVGACDVGCHRGDTPEGDHDCACAAYLETGARKAEAGTVGLRLRGARVPAKRVRSEAQWFGRLCGQLGGAIVAGLVDGVKSAPEPTERPRDHRPLLTTLAFATGGVALAGGLMVSMSPQTIDPPCSLERPPQILLDPATPPPTVVKPPVSPPPELEKQPEVKRRYTFAPGRMAIRRAPTNYGKVTPRKR